MRLDNYLLENNYFSSRTKAKRAIEEGAIMVNDKVCDKPSYIVLDDDIIKIVKETNKYVSQGGLKLEAAINEFFLDFANLVVLDIGASTGGFTDCALKHGAKKVYAVDVGTNQLVDSLKNDNRVISLENTNILDLPTFEDKIDVIVTDVSFVSISHIFKALKFYLNEADMLICLVKPQFEVGKIHLKNGVVKDKKQHVEVLENVNKLFNDNGLYINKAIKSPVKGGSGNQEFLIKVTKNKSGAINFREVV